jgi:hypothetical protein
VTFADCPREQDVIDALTTDQWPDRCDGELQAHVTTCDGCRDLVAVLAPLGAHWTDSRADAQVPASGMVWWRAQMRARREAARTAARPITVVQSIAGLAVAALAIICVVMASPWLASSFTTSRQFLAVDVTDLAALASGWWLAGALALVGVTSLAVYLVVAED